ncbi:MAG: LysR family transcriptional regulator, partial [Clostridia bacterium]|nr:LysR family transcriptional regulator [Clostridia bacterium]
AQTRSFTKAAEMLDYAQSSVTAQIRSMEDELGTRLFERLGRKVVLTQAGERLLAYSEKILQLAAEAVEVVRGASLYKGTLTIGAPESLCVYRLPPLFFEFRRQFPEVQLIIKPGVNSIMRQACKDGTLDLVFTIEGEISDEYLKMEKITTEPLALATSPNHPLAKKSPVNPDDLNGQNLFVTESGCCYRRMLEETLLSADVRPASLQEFGSIEAIKQCVMNGLGVTLLPEIAVAGEIALGRLVKLDWGGPDFTIATQLCYHKDKWISPILGAFLELTRNIVKEC